MPHATWDDSCSPSKRSDLHVGVLSTYSKSQFHFPSQECKSSVNPPMAILCKPLQSNHSSSSAPRSRSS
ncbi:hypothetical protein SAY87_018718 [Trapa incisa]|uniref:Uncharacterized protein n=1 Tax=Trapa incisa TaxID=236973 RepID=A0AAN7K3B3_9MYRT|nr:hypothetical protein SAY87_018718 [Trapa incisa]